MLLFDFVQLFLVLLSHKLFMFLNDLLLVTDLFDAILFTEILGCLLDELRLGLRLNELHRWWLDECLLLMLRESAELLLSLMVLYELVGDLFGRLNLQNLRLWFRIERKLWLRIEQLALKGGHRLYRKWILLLENGLLNIRCRQ